MGAPPDGSPAQSETTFRPAARSWAWSAAASAVSNRIPVSIPGVESPSGPPTLAWESLEPADLLLLYTDGLTEARRPDGELFTVERLGEFIERQAAKGLPAPETLRGLREAIIERGEGSLRDDATALLLEWRKGTEHALLPRTV